ncbi:MAG: NAD-dependent epimerase/dehydratase family protein, partial [Ilumatobacteraceae bacterium]
PDVVVHLATHFLSSHEPRDIPDLVRVNVEWGAVVAEAASRAGARLVTVGTAWQHFEGRNYDPVSLYAATKQAYDDIVTYYAAVQGLDVCRVTLFDTYGPGDTRPKLVPALLDAALSGEALSMSDGGQLIDLTYVTDVARGIVGVALDSTGEDEVVLRSWHPVTVRHLVDEVSAVTGRQVPVRWGVRPERPREMREDWVFGAGPTGWQPMVDLREGLERCWRARTGG